MNGISVIICCFNSASRLPQTMKYVAAQEVTDKIAWEIILVNNASTDNTTEVAMYEWQKYNKTIPFTITDQPIRGLTAAREKGIKEAKFDYLLFCDDDNWLNSDYIEIAFECMEKRKDVGIIGGCSSGSFEIPEPFWFQTFSQSYVVERPLKESGYLPVTREYLAGAGMIIRKQLLSAMKDVGFTPILTDRIGNGMPSTNIRSPKMQS